jgi:hypothetical protein
VFGFFGGNPVSILEGRVSRVILRGVEAGGGTVFEKTGLTSLQGVVHQGGKPVGGAAVQIFLDAARYFRGPGYASAMTDGEGRFTIDLPPGRYYVVARHRKTAARVGPLNVGDLYGYYPDNPVYLEEGVSATLELPLLTVEKEPSEALMEATVGSVLRGRVTDPGGAPVEGVFACLYTSPEPMGRPAFASEATDGRGRFQIRVTEGGDHWLVARRDIGRPLGPDDYVAFYRGTEGHRLTVEPGRDVAGLEIIWEER